MTLSNKSLRLKLSAIDSLHASGDELKRRDCGYPGGLREDLRIAGVHSLGSDCLPLSRDFVSGLSAPGRILLSCGVEPPKLPLSRPLP